MDFDGQGPVDTERENVIAKRIWESYSFSRREELESVMHFPQQHNPKLRNEEEDRRPRIGLAFSSGAARGLAHIGVVAELERAGIKIDAVAGTSMGGYIGALLAAGYRAEQMEILASQMPDRSTLLRLLDFEIPPTKGLIRGMRLERYFRRSLKSLQFADLRLPLSIVATNLDTLEREVFQQGSVVQAVMASCAIPGLFRPYEIDGVRYADGAIAEPLPVPALRESGLCDLIISVNAIPTVGDLHAKPLLALGEGEHTGGAARFGHWLGAWANLAAPGNIGDTLSRSVLSLQIRLADKASAAADIAIHPVSDGASWHDYHNYRDYIALGQRTTAERLPAIRKAIEAWSAEANHGNIRATPSLQVQE